MRNAHRLLASLLAAASLSGAAAATPAADAFTHKRMSLAGFIPLEEMTFGGRDVRRVLLIDPYGFLPIPGIELERHADGRLTLRAQYRGWTGPAYSVSQAEWDRLALLEPSGFAPPGENRFKARPNVVVHCWGGLLESSPGKAARWWGCDSGTRAAQTYSEAVLALAMHKRECPQNEKDPLWRFSHCFADSAALDDPALQEKLVDLRSRWARQREPGSDILMKARLALRAARDDRTSARIAEAREAVFAFGRQQEALRAVLQSGFAAFSDIDEAGGRNAIILAETRREWNRDIEGQSRNYIELLENLARLAAEAPKR